MEQPYSNSLKADSLNAPSKNSTNLSGNEKDKGSKQPTDSVVQASSSNVQYKNHVNPEQNQDSIFNYRLNPNSGMKPQQDDVQNVITLRKEIEKRSNNLQPPKNINSDILGCSQFIYQQCKAQKLLEIQKTLNSLNFNAQINEGHGVPFQDIMSKTPFGLLCCGSYQ